MTAVIRRRIPNCFLFLLFCASLASAQGTYTQLDFPAALMSEATGINAAGQIVGIYENLTGGHGFILQNGIYTTLDYPGAQYSYAQGINNRGQIVGLAEPIGYLYEMETQAFIPLQVPGASYTYPLAINDAGAVAGYFEGPNITYKGFELVGFGYPQIVPPGSIATFVTGISASGKLVGYADINNSYTDFTFSQGKYRTVAMPGVTSPFVLGTNPAGTALVGYYEPFTGITGFVYRDNVLQALSFPGSISTIASGINSQGDVVGYFIDSSFVTHGFLWRPPKEAASAAQSQ